VSTQQILKTWALRIRPSRGSWPKEDPVWIPVGLQSSVFSKAIAVIAVIAVIEKRLRLSTSKLVQQRLKVNSLASLPTFGFQWHLKLTRSCVQESVHIDCLRKSRCFEHVVLFEMGSAPKFQWWRICDNDSNDDELCLFWGLSQHFKTKLCLQSTPNILNHSWCFPHLLDNMRFTSVCAKNPENQHLSKRSPRNVCWWCFDIFWLTFRGTPDFTRLSCAHGDVWL